MIAYHETIFYRLDTGAIVACNTVAAEHLDIQVPPTGCGHLVIDTPFKDFIEASTQAYVIGGQVVRKISMGLTVNKTTLTAGGTDEVTITGIPKNAVVNISGVVSAGPETVTDGELIVTSTTPGAINVTVSLAPAYFDWSITLNAV